MRAVSVASGLMAAALILVAAAPVQAQSREPGAAQGAGATVLVLPFANLTGNPADDWIGAGIAEAVATDLQAGGTRTLRATRPELDESDPGQGWEAALEAGRLAGAALVISGAYQRLGDEIRVTARLVDVMGGTVIRSAMATGRTDEMFDLQDQVAASLRDAPAVAQSQPNRGPARRRAPRSTPDSLTVRPRRSRRLS